MCQSRINIILKMNCPICNEDARNCLRFFTKEMMHGTRIRFEYISCTNCTCLFINEIPPNLKEYYNNYYTADKHFIAITTLKRYLWAIRSYLTIIGLYSIVSILRSNSILRWISNINIHLTDPILDVGCGNGDILYEFSKHGFKQLHGVDPFPPDKTSQIFNWQFVKGDIFSIYNKKFKLIMFNHSLEHTFEHYKILEKANELLSENGTILIRMPIVNKAFEDYKENWVQLDAPRHLLIHSKKSIDLLCSKLGLEIYKTIFDSTEFQFMGSVQYKNNIAYYDHNSYKVNSKVNMFSPADQSKYMDLAKKYNRLGMGDQAAFFIKRIIS